MEIRTSFCGRAGRVRAICSDCNSRIGTEFAVGDPQIRHTLKSRRRQSDLPGFAERNARTV